MLTVIFIVPALSIHALADANPKSLPITPESEITIEPANLFHYLLVITIVLI
jgi:hypothetical protein